MPAKSNYKLTTDKLSDTRTTLSAFTDKVNSYLENNLPALRRRIEQERDHHNRMMNVLRIRRRAGLEWQTQVCDINASRREIWRLRARIVELQATNIPMSNKYLRSIVSRYIGYNSHPSWDFDED